MIELKATSAKGQAIIDDLYRAGDTDIYDAYDRPSRRKVFCFNEIKDRAESTNGYNYDLHITGTNSSYFSTIYSYTEPNGDKVVIKDTYANTYKVIIPAVVKIEQTAAELETA